MITPGAKITLINNVSRMFPRIERGDIEQEYFIQRFRDPQDNKYVARWRLIDWFSSRRWQDSDEGKVKHFSYEMLYEIEKPVTVSPEPGYIDKILADGLLASLCQRDQDIFVLYFWYGMTLVETGQVLGVKKSTVSKRIQMGLEKMRKALPL